MPKRAKHPKLPNGYGSIKYLGSGRRNPYAVHPPTKEFTLSGSPKTPPALCYVNDWYKGFTVLTWYKNDEYYPGREKELADDPSDLKKQVEAILATYNQKIKTSKALKTYTDVFKEYYKDKFKHDYGNKEKKTQMEKSICAAYKNTNALHEKIFYDLTQKDLQQVIDSCNLKYSSVELILTLFRQMYTYADANSLAKKNYAKFVKINRENDNEHGVPFTDTELKKLWKNKDNVTIEMLLIMCYSGFRISAYKSMKVDIEQKLFNGGVKNRYSKNRIVPIHSSIYDLVKRRMKRDGNLLNCSTQDFRY